MEGILILNKPSGMTSHDVVAKIRRRFSMQRVGHAGTLDPLATGILVILLGKSTQLFEKFVAFDKAYRATLKLGVTTTSADIEGKVLQVAPYEHLPIERIEQTFHSFLGEIQQLPPMVSAVKVKGKKLYQLARRGIEVERQARTVVIKALQIEEIVLPEIRFYLECSKGTYVRQLAHDIGESLGCGACITQIQRTQVGPFFMEDSVNLEDVDERHIRPWQG